MAKSLAVFLVLFLIGVLSGLGFGRGILRRTWARLRGKRVG